MKLAAPVVLTVGIVGIGVAGTPRLLSSFDFFEIRQVEIVGVRYLTPDEILDAAQIEETGNLFRNMESVEDRVRNVPGVVDVELDRKLPGTLRIAVAERVPVAFVTGPDALIALDEDAHPLPYDPAGGQLDLPIIQRADFELTGVLAEIRRTAPELYGIIDHAEYHESGGVVLHTGRRRLLFPITPSRDVVRSVVAVQRRILDAGSDFLELDARYDGLVISRGSAS